jgi:hypothetical protein
MPLPEVPVVGGEAAAPQAQPAAPGRDARLKGPMDMDVFEAGLQREGFGVGPKTAPEVEGGSSGYGEALESADPNALCSVFIGRNSNPAVHALVAELQGIPLEQAEKACQKAVVAIARDVTLEAVGALRARFLKLNVHPRVLLKR